MPCRSKWTWSLEAPLQLAVKAREFDWRPTELLPLPKEPVKGGRSVQVLLVPYGCTKFRVTHVSGKRGGMGQQSVRLLLSSATKG